MDPPIGRLVVVLLIIFAVELSLLWFFVERLRQKERKAEEEHNPAHPPRAA